MMQKQKMKTHSLVAFFLLALIPWQARAADPLAAMNSWVEGRLSASSGSAGAYVFLFLGGLLASLLPCVYPLYPITASIVKRRATPGGPRWPHPVTYFLGMATMYFVFGLIAGVTGGAFNAILRLPAVNIGIAAIFLVLALATSGLLHLQLFSGGQMGDKTAGLPGTFLMGLGAGLLSSSCVGPFVVTILINIASADPAAGFALGAALGAAGKMLAFGLGLGATFLVVGLFGARLPKSGAWMGYVQWALGGLILWFSYVYLEKGLAGYGLEASVPGLVFVGGLALLVSVYIGQSETMDAGKRMEKALCALVAAVGLLLLARGLLPAPSAGVNAAAPSLGAGAVGGPEVEVNGKLTWFVNRADALAEAKRMGRPVFVDFYGSWCSNCKAFDALTQSDEKLGAALGSAVLLKVRDTSPLFKEFQDDPRFPELKVGLPFFVIMDADGNLLYKTSDYTRTDEMILFLEE